MLEILTKGGKQKIGFVLREDVEILIAKARNVSTNIKILFRDWLISLGFLYENTRIIETRKETEFIDELSDFLKAQNITDGIRQFRVLNYRIDYYIPWLKLAVEYDENEHKNYSYERQEYRQLEIEKELECEFIRVSDNKSNAYNIGLIAKIICT